MRSSLQFLGGAGTVTGSKFLLRLGADAFLIDCGLFQGLKELRLQNWAPFPVDAREIKAVLLTHAHLDHCGYLPLLLREGFEGPVISTAPTRDLSKVILTDSAKINEEDAERANAGGYSKHSPAKPLYTTEEAHRAIGRFETHPLDTWLPLVEGVRFRLSNAGHILGSSIIEIETPDFTIAFTGDLGRSDPLVLRPPNHLLRADYLVTESTYGDRVHSPLSPLKELARIVNETTDAGGHVIIPAFAVGRSQDILFLLSTLKRQSQIKEIPVFLDSPMGINATEIFLDYPEWHRLNTEEIQRLCQSVTMVKSPQQSDELLRRKDSSIVIAGSGMMSGGRVLSHLMHRLPDARNTVVITGFQPPSTRGSLLQTGIDELKIYGEYVPVRARVETISALSAHADQRDILKWMSHFESAPRNTFIVHGEAQAANALQVKLRDALGWKSAVAKQGEVVKLEPRAARG